jgi:hypothetical protein
MSLARSRQESRPESLQGGADHAALPARAEPGGQAGKPAAARLADDQAAPSPSPVHRLQAELAQLTEPVLAPGEVGAEGLGEGLYPGWFRLAFPLVSSAMLWAAILWGVGIFA